MDFSLSIIRHGNTLATEKNLYCGYKDIDITRKGRKEILSYKKQGIYPECALFFTSELIRTISTLKLIYGNDIKFKTIYNLNEQNIGNLDMKSYDDIKDKKLYRNWLNDITGDVKCPNGESLNEFKLRVKMGFYQIIEEIKNSNKNSALLVTHAGVISVIMNSIFVNEKDSKSWHPNPALGYTLYYSNNNFINYKELTKVR